jgi:hypothetical protein
MVGKEIIEYIKSNRKPKDGYSLVIGLSANDSNRYYASVYRRVEIFSRKYGKEYADTSVANIMTKDLEAYKKFIVEYTDKRVNLPVTYATN